jgi:hypothetical protein
LTKLDAGSNRRVERRLMCRKRRKKKPKIKLHATRTR